MGADSLAKGRRLRADPTDPARQRTVKREFDGIFEEQTSGVKGAAGEKGGVPTSGKGKAPVLDRQLAFVSKAPSIAGGRKPGGETGGITTGKRHDT